MKKALVFGIDSYDNFSPLRGCVKDARAMENILKKNEDGSPNFDVRLFTSDTFRISSTLIAEETENLFKGDAETALFYFAGHGAINEQTNHGFLISQDGKKGSFGFSLTEILALANKAYPRIKSTVIILDSCCSGAMGEIPALGQELSAIGNGVTILTACHRTGVAEETEEEHGVFTSILIDGLKGSSADIMGRITPAFLYSHVDQTLGPWEQRPIYKANVQTFVILRQVNPKISLDILRRLPSYFSSAHYQLPLDPSFEPDRNNIPPEFRGLPIDKEKTAIFKDLQLYNRQGLLVPVEADHMYNAAIESKSCKLTLLGAHYLKLANMGRI